MVKFNLQTYGCKLNQSDSDVIRGLLSQQFEEASENEADFIVLNTCGVIKKTERKIMRKVDELKRKNKKIILTGCLPLISHATVERGDAVVAPRELLKIKQAAEEMLQGKKPIFLDNSEALDKARLYNLKKRKKDNMVSAVVAISEGCVGNCSYCATRFARGKLKSFNQEAITKEIKALVDRGYKEIHLTSQDAGCYGLDNGKLELPALLDRIVSVSGDFKVRIGMAHPFFVKEMMSDLISVFKSEKIYNFLHLPIQSGSDKVLSAMQRNYKAKDVEETVREFRSQLGETLIALDVIIGFPGEDEDDFEQTIRMIKNIEPNIVHINKFSSRPCIPAEKLTQVPIKVKSARSKFLTGFCRKLKREVNKKFIGKEYKVLVVRKGKNNTFLSRPQSFRAVILKKGKVGEVKKVKITDARSNYLIGG